jgi:hypothetical protein
MKQATLHVTFMACIFLTAHVRADEGMFPISLIHELGLESKGLAVGARQVYDPDGVGLVDAIVNVGTCTGSFVSPEGLILTNHHCTHSAVQAASTVEENLLEQGFLARSRSEEIPAAGRLARIMVSSEDVTERVLTGLTDGMDPPERTRAIERARRMIIGETEKQYPGKRAEVAEMFAGRSYVLFTYIVLPDVRLVYVPPRGIGNFGGEVDNWMWPRHTGDFAFMRAYVAPDGSPAEYSPSNVPYRPRVHLRVQPDGANEGDFVFILGYPGRTFRHTSSHYLSFEYEVRMPHVVEWNSWLLSLLAEQGDVDEAVDIKYADWVRRLSNTEKNHRGKLAGIRRLQLIDRRLQEERALRQFIESDAQRTAQFGSVLDEIGKVYAEMRETFGMDALLDDIRSSQTLLSVALTLYDGAIELQKPDMERSSQFTQRNIERTRENITSQLGNIDLETDRTIVHRLLMRAVGMSSEEQLSGLMRVTGTTKESIGRFVGQAYRNPRLLDEVFALKLLSEDSATIAGMSDPLVRLAVALHPIIDAQRARRMYRDGLLTRYSALFVHARQEFLKKDFIPDANRTLRLTYGTIKGYAPADALYARPMTTVRGIIEKNTGRKPFDAPRKLIDLHRERKFGRFAATSLNDVPVALLYDLDTTGGNSGSPLLNARGEVVGVNFDRVWDATVNDYAWSTEYSRSIAVDIRYVLWVTQMFAGADFLLQEMGVCDLGFDL